MIIGLTHDEQGAVRIRRSVTTKVAIGLGPSKGSNYPQKLDHFILLKKGTVDGKVAWVQDDEKNKHYGDKPTSLAIVLLDDSPDDVFRTEYAWYGKTGRKCWGDGNNATRRTEKNPDGEPWVPCANAGCPDLESGNCKPSGDLYFMLADYPSLGTVCRLHTSSYQSIPELYTALRDLHAMMGGRLFGLPVTLFVRPEKNVYTDKQNHEVTGTKWVLGLELSAASLPKMLEGVAESAKVFADMRRLMGGRKLEIIDDEATRAEEIHGEFYPADKLLEAAPIAPAPILKELEALFDTAGINQAGRSMMAGQYDGRLPELKAALIAQLEKSSPKPTAPQEQPAGSDPAPTANGKGKGRKPAAIASGDAAGDPSPTKAGEFSF